MVKVFYVLSVIGFLICFIGLEIWLIYKSREKFIELKKAYKELKEAKNNLFSDGKK